MYTSISDILKDLAVHGKVQYPVKFNHGSYDKESLWNLLQDNLETKYEHFDVICNFQIHYCYNNIFVVEYTEDELHRAGMIIDELQKNDGFVEPENAFPQEYLDVVEDSEVNGGNNVTPSVIAKYLEYTKTLSDYDNIFYFRKLLNDHKVFITFARNPEFVEFVEKFSNVMRLIRTSDYKELFEK